MARKDRDTGIGHLINRYDYVDYRYPPNRLCLRCHFVTKGDLCPHCRVPTAIIDGWGRPRPPRKRASRTAWRKFLKRFGLDVVKEHVLRKKIR